MRGAAAITNGPTRARRGAVRRAAPSESSPAAPRALARARRRGLAFDAIVAAGPNGACPHADDARRRDRRRTRRRRRRRRRLDGYASDCTRTFATGRLPDELARAYDGLPRGAAGRARRRRARRERTGRRRGRARGDRGGRLRRAVRPRPRPRRRPRGPRGCRDARPESKDTLEPSNVVTVEPGMYLPGSAASGSRTSWSSARTEPRASRPSQRARHGWLALRRGRNGLHQPVQERDAHRARRPDWRIVEFQHVKPGKGGAFVRTKLKATTRAPSSTRRSAPARSCRASTPSQERPVPVRRRRRGRLHGRGELRADPLPRDARGRAARSCAVENGAAAMVGDRPSASRCRRRSSSRSPTPSPA